MDGSARIKAFMTDLDGNELQPSASEVPEVANKT